MSQDSKDIENLIRNHELILETYGRITYEAIHREELTIEVLQALELEREHLVHLLKHTQSLLDATPLVELSDSSTIARLRTLSLKMDEIRNLDDELYKRTQELSYRMLKEFHSSQLREGYGKSGTSWK